MPTLRNQNFDSLGVIVSRLALLASAAAVSFEPNSREQPQCRYVPGDVGWPSTAEWETLNTTVSGRLIATNPISHVCHDPNFDAAACEALQEQFGQPEIAYPFPGEFLSPWSQNQSCIPFTDDSTPCTLGNYASYSINVTGVHDIQAGVLFAEASNIRLVVKNTGHDILGKSTGKGSLSLWTHNLNTLDFIQSYTSTYYEGPAMKLGAGIQGGEAEKFAFSNGYRVAAGNCPTVGIAGGYTQGGGFSLLSGMYGLGADNVLEWEVVTAAGKHVTASPTENSDLYYALSGGGGGTYGVVVSMTVRVHPETPVSAASLFFNTATAGGVEAYWSAVQTFHQELQPLIDQHYITAAYIVTNDTFTLLMMLAPNATSAADLTSIMNPLILALQDHIPSLTPQTLGYSSFDSDSFYGLFSTTLAPILATQAASAVVGGRFLSRLNLATDPAGVNEAMRAATEGGRFEWACEAGNTNRSALAVAPVAAENGVTNDWRGAVSECMIAAVWTWQTDGATNWPGVAELQDELLTSIMPIVEAKTPGAGAYLNEASWKQDNFQVEFYGSWGHYNKLKTIKQTYDPSDLFWANTAVGSEAWTPDTEGRLCRAVA